MTSLFDCSPSSSFSAGDRRTNGVCVVQSGAAVLTVAVLVFAVLSASGHFFSLCWVFSNCVLLTVTVVGLQSWFVAMTAADGGAAPNAAAATAQLLDTGVCTFVDGPQSLPGCPSLQGFVAALGPLAARDNQSGWSDYVWQAGSGAGVAQPRATAFGEMISVVSIVDIERIQAIVPTAVVAATLIPGQPATIPNPVKCAERIIAGLCNFVAPPCNSSCAPQLACPLLSLDPSVCGNILDLYEYLAPNSVTQFDLRAVLKTLMSTEELLLLDVMLASVMVCHNDATQLAEPIDVSVPASTISDGSSAGWSVLCQEANCWWPFQQTHTQLSSAANYSITQMEARQETGACDASVWRSVVAARSDSAPVLSKASQNLHQLVPFVAAVILLGVALTTVLYHAKPSACLFVGVRRGRSKNRVVSRQLPSEDKKQQQEEEEEEEEEVDDDAEVNIDEVSGVEEPQEQNMWMVWRHLVWQSRDILAWSTAGLVLCVTCWAMALAQPTGTVHTLLFMSASLALLVGSLMWPCGWPVTFAKVMGIVSVSEQRGRSGIHSSLVVRCVRGMMSWYRQYFGLKSGHHYWTKVWLAELLEVAAQSINVITLAGTVDSRVLMILVAGMSVNSCIPCLYLVIRLERHRRQAILAADTFVDLFYMGFSLAVIGPSDMSILQSVAFIYPTLMHLTRISSVSSNVAERAWTKLHDDTREFYLQTHSAVKNRVPTGPGVALPVITPGLTRTYTISATRTHNTADSLPPSSSSSSPPVTHRLPSVTDQRHQSRGVRRKSDYLIILSALLGVLLFASSLYRVLQQKTHCEDTATKELWAHSSPQVYFAGGFFSKSKCGFGEVETLDLSGRLHGTLPDSVGLYTSLKTLRVGNNGLTSLPSSLVHLTSTLETLDLSGNSLSSLPLFLDAFPALIDVDARNNNLQPGGLSPGLFHLPKVRLLLSGNPVASTLRWIHQHGVVELFRKDPAVFPAFATAFGDTLIELEIAHTPDRLAFSPGWFSAVPSLTTLSVVNCSMEHMPVLIALSALMHLDVSHNLLVSGQDMLFQLATFPRLQSLNLAYNRLQLLSSSMGRWPHALNITGNAPTQIQWSLAPGPLVVQRLATLNLSQATYLDLTSVIFSSWPLRPAQLQQLSQLTFLSFYSSRIVDVLPSEISALTSLTVLDLFGNTLSAPSLSILNSLTRLQRLDLAINNFTDLPSRMGDMTQLQYVDLHDNRNMRGTFPAGFWSNLTLLKVLDMSRIAVSGRMEPGLGAYTSLEILRLDRLNVSGTLPTAAMRSWSNLKTMSFFETQLSGVLPVFDDCSRLTFYDVEGCNFQGVPFPYFTNCTALTHLVLQRNPLLSGQLTPAVAKLSQLENLYLEDCAVSGQLPTQLGQLQRLQYLRVYNTQLSGPIPSQIGTLPVLTILSLGGPQSAVNGTLPSGLVQLSNLFAVKAAGPRITGTIPQFMSQRLRTLQLSHAALSGTIPSLVPYPSLSTVILSLLPGIHGTLPPLPSQVTTVNISGNPHVGGTIPPQWGNLTLSSLSVSRNNLTGTIPAFSALPQGLPIVLSFANNMLLSAVSLELAASLPNTTTLDLRNTSIITLPVGLVNKSNVLWP